MFLNKSEICSLINTKHMKINIGNKIYDVTFLIKVIYCSLINRKHLKINTGNKIYGKSRF